MFRRFPRRLEIGVLLITLGSFVAAAPAADGRPTGRAAATSTVEFTVTQPPQSAAQVRFTGGITNIVLQAAAGKNLQGFSAITLPGSTGFNVGSVDTLPATTMVTVKGQLSSGTPITGTAVLPAGATMSAGVGFGAQQPIQSGAFSINVPPSLAAAPVPRLGVSPSRVHAGERVKVSGNVAGDCARGDAVTLLSRAFTNTYSFAGVPAIYATVGRGGAFSVKTTIPASRRPSSYAVTGRCGGGNLGVTAHERVLQPTHSSYTLRSSTVTVSPFPYSYPTLYGVCAEGYHVGRHGADPFFGVITHGVDIYVYKAVGTHPTGSSDPSGVPYYRGLGVTLGNRAYTKYRDGSFSWRCDPN